MKKCQTPCYTTWQNKIQFPLFASVESARLRELSAKITAGCFSENAYLQYQHKKEKKKKTQYQHTQDSPASVPSLRTALFWSSGPATSVKTPSSFTKQSYKESFWTIKIKHQDFLSYDNIWQNNI